MQGTRKDLYKDSKHPRLNPNQKQHNFNLHHGFETSKLPCSTKTTASEKGTDGRVPSCCARNLHCWWRKLMDEACKDLLRDVNSLKVQVRCGK